MPVVTFITHDGESREVKVEVGTTIMQAAVDNGIDAIVAECGGSCSCATCHCYIDEAWFEKAGSPGDIEKDMIDCALDPAETSRLSCQVTITDELDGLVVRLPESQF